uniref:Uncharacterized protein n=1 Tax=Strombidium inclinatum TaxID=197538 RepID=A0A7S3IXQ4_9SPIT
MAAHLGQGTLLGLDLDGLECFDIFWNLTELLGNRYFSFLLHFVELGLDLLHIGTLLNELKSVLQALLESPGTLIVVDREHLELLESGVISDGFSLGFKLFHQNGLNG